MSGLLKSNLGQLADSFLKGSDSGNAGQDAKYFQRGKIQELRTELNSDKKDTKHTKKKVVLKKIVANMTMGNDMSPLFTDVVACMSIPSLEIKKMVYLYLINYAKSKPDIALMVVNSFTKDLSDMNPLIRALAIRTMGYIHVDKIMDSLCGLLRTCLTDRDSYVCKTAAMCVAKLYSYDKHLVQSEGFLDLLRGLLNHENSTVVANAVVALLEISEKSDTLDLVLDVGTANRLLTALNECTEWGQTYILEAMMFVVPQEHADAELLAERIVPRLQHANSAVVLTTVKVILYLMNYIESEDIVNGLYKKLGPPLITLLHNGPEVQYVALRNIQLVLQKKPDLLMKNEMKVFFCKYDDPIYVKLAKLEIMFRLANVTTVDQVLSELKEYSVEVDVDFARKAVRCIGRCAIKIESAADKCVDALLELITSKVSYVVQEAVVVIKDIFRKYPNRYESIIGTLCQNLDSLDEPEAKASMIWIIGQYADRIENADDLLDSFLDSFKEEAPEVQLSLLTAVVKLFIKRPSAGQELVPKVLKWSTEEADNPDLRDRGFIYWRLLSTDPVAAKAVILSDKPPISTETDNMDSALLDELLLSIATMASIYHKPAVSFIGGSKSRVVPQSRALVTPVMRRTAAKDPPAKVQSLYENGVMSNPYANDINPMRDLNLLDLDPVEHTNVDDGYAAFGGSNNDFMPSNMGSMGNFGSNDFNSKSGSGNTTIIETKKTFSSTTITQPGNMIQQPFSQAPVPQAQSNMMVLANTVNAMTLAASNHEGGGGNNGGITDLMSLQLQNGFVPPKSVYMNAQSGRGLEVQGTFARRQREIYMDLTFTNRALQPLTEFSILFNKNTFSLTPAQPLQVRVPLFPNQSSETSLPLKIEALPQLSSPVNNLQIALKSNAGISYFQVLIPLHVLFIENGQVEQNEWLQMWKQDIPDSNEVKRTLNGLVFGNGGGNGVELVRSKLALNNVFLIAQRSIESGLVVLYTSTKLQDGTAFLSEIKFDGGMRNALVSTKSYAAHLVGVYHDALDGIMHHV
ncbi:hypothetical protein SmJEL517_g04087 [Synchytrium microbalum]|uniref:Beta-adaptin appendage C-terminal subdomain domain-containing protein n=1 Tax=Synchytrium microbalum TaxID=1806994 RepID=A0A507C5U4_9FUNG|nr:uncharacterized protein SmJEL517_g04087 [Synchytrium microbalum]TPX32913.1 hypothetical protein SmJEL517_g04087 [Synchytrium microbalum]